MLPAGTRCTLYGQPITESTISSLTPVTGDPDVAFSAAFARAVTSLQVKLKAKQVADAERAVVAARFGGSFARYRAALAKAHASPGSRAASSATSCAAAGDRVAASTSAARRPRRSASTTRPTARRGRGSSRRRRAAPVARECASAASRSSRWPRRSSSRFPQGRGWHSIRTMRGTYQVRALDSPVSLGALPLGVATAGDRDRAQGARARRPLRGVAAGARARCSTSRRSAAATPSPQVGVVELTDYLPFLAAD